MDRARLAYVTAAAVGAGTVMVFLWWWWTRKQGEKPPSKWRKVGELSDLVAFPIKSLGPIRLTSMECTPLGLKSGWLRDRSLMVIDLEGHFVTARQQPKMVQVSPTIEDSILTLQAPGMMSISIDLSRIRGKWFLTAVWGHAVPALDCGEEIARWLSRFIFQEDTGLRLVYYPLDRARREVRRKSAAFPLLKAEDSGAYPDATSYCLINEVSVNDLNTKLDEPVVTQNFRPNFVVKGAIAYDEDTWDWVKIGDVVFRNVMPCTRCILTTVDPETGTKNANAEPLKTLKTYRQIQDSNIRRFVGESPVMGIHLALRDKRQKISVKLGDPIYVGVSDEEVPPLVSPP